MAKDKAAIVSGAGWLGGFADLLVREMLAQGWMYDEIHALVTQTRPEDQPIQAIVAGMRRSFPSKDIAAKHGYEVVQDVAAPTDFQVKNLKFIPFMKAGDPLFIDGDTMWSRAVELRGNFGLCDAPRLLDQQADIPVELHDKYIILAGTKLRGLSGVLYVAYLYWDGKQWYLDFLRIDYAWGEGGRLPRCK